MLARKATAVALTYDACRAQMTHAHTQRVEVTGNPVRQSFLELLDTTRRAEARAAFRACYGIADDAVVLMVFGGSQGARSINDAVLNNAPRILESASHVLHLTGASQLDAVETQLAQSLSAEQLKRWHAIGYCNQMDAAFVASDLVLSRAGASSLAEIAALGMPACVVPYPYATDDHQTANARALVEAGAARCVPDAELQSPLFMQNLCELLDNATLRCQMAAAARASNAAAATNKLIQLLYHIAQQELRDKHDALR
jgi:UDP-N-acetylglucosamine--N-acetylmuramyl-(pentapeptide) pyrophosphoryl-undecaprenol N-acetylglucosamine transferase